MNSFLAYCRVFCLIILLSSMPVVLVSEADDASVEKSTLGLKLKDKEGNSVKTMDGLHFLLPEDWPVEKKDGLVVPMEIYEYVATNFKKVETRLETIENRLGEMDIELEKAGHGGAKKSFLSSNETKFGEIEGRIAALELALRNLESANDRFNKAREVKQLQSARSLTSRLNALERRFEDLAIMVEGISRKLEHGAINVQEFDFE